jgi:hypothetical protein
MRHKRQFFRQEALHAHAHGTAAVRRSNWSACMFVILLYQVFRGNKNLACASSGGLTKQGKDDDRAADKHPSPKVALGWFAQIHSPRDGGMVDESLFCFAILSEKENEMCGATIRARGANSGPNRGLYDLFEFP